MFQPRLSAKWTLFAETGGLGARRQDRNVGVSVTPDEEAGRTREVEPGQARWARADPTSKLGLVVSDLAELASSICWGPHGANGTFAEGSRRSCRSVAVAPEAGS